ncbi:MAG: hypothetical protein ABW158_04190 [Candidatus Thiodiazotropha sp. 6PDIVS]
MAFGNHTRIQSTLTVFLLLSVTLMGCGGTQQTRISYRASDTLLYKNPIKRVAIVGEAKVMRPRMGGKSAVLSLSSSKLLIENALPKLKSAFESKGYEVTHAEPAGVGYYWRGPDDYWVYDFDAKDKSNDKWRVENMEPVFEYQTIKSNHEVSSAVREEFERLNDSISMNRLSVYFPEYRNVSAIANNTGANTVCFARLWGKRYSAGRIAGDVALKVLVAMLGGVPAGGLQEEKTMNIACSNVKTKQLVWQNTYTSFEDPIGSVKYKSVTEAGEIEQTVSLADTDRVGSSDETSFLDTFFVNAIKDLPAAGQTFSSDCRMTDRAKMIVSCTKKNSANTVAQTY